MVTSSSKSTNLLSVSASVAGLFASKFLEKRRSKIVACDDESDDAASQGSWEARFCTSGSKHFPLARETIHYDIHLVHGSPSNENAVAAVVQPFSCDPRQRTLRLYALIFLDLKRVEACTRSTKARSLAFNLFKLTHHTTSPKGRSKSLPNSPTNDKLSPVRRRKSWESQFSAADDLRAQQRERNAQIRAKEQSLRVQAEAIADFVHKRLTPSTPHMYSLSKDGISSCGALRTQKACSLVAPRTDPFTCALPELRHIRRKKSDPKTSIAVSDESGEWDGCASSLEAMGAFLTATKPMLPLLPRFRPQLQEPGLFEGLNNDDWEVLRSKFVAGKSSNRVRSSASIMYSVQAITSLSFGMKRSSSSPSALAVTAKLISAKSKLASAAAVSRCKSPTNVQEFHQHEAAAARLAATAASTQLNAAKARRPHAHRRSHTFTTRM